MSWRAFFGNMGRALDLGATFRDNRRSAIREKIKFGLACPWEADCEALRGDWRAVGNDLRRAMEKVGEELRGMKHGSVKHK